jgi:phospholipid/cholesterol/gamma-HCH transport system ATP-binding protein
MAMITVRDLTIGHRGAPLMEHVDFEVDRGDIFLILGGSGAGKSTMLRHLIGLQAPMRGRIELEGIGDPCLAHGRRPQFGVMFQSGALFGSMTLAQNIALPLETWTDLDAETIASVVGGTLRLVGLEGAGDRLPSELSGGMKKRAGIARALALSNDLLFLDEPSAGHDPISAAELDELLVTLNRSLGLTLVVVTHELESIYRIGNRCILLDKRTRGILARGEPRRLRDSSQDDYVRAFFNRKPMEHVR